MSPAKYPARSARAQHQEAEGREKMSLYSAVLGSSYCPRAHVLLWYTPRLITGSHPRVSSLRPSVLPSTLTCPSASVEPSSGPSFLLSPADWVRRPLSL